MVTFPVDDVTPVTDALPTRPIADLFPGARATGGSARVLEPNGVHPLLHAVSKAFAEHRPLVLSPDAVWLTIARGIAEHVKEHAEELRPVLVGHRGKQRLEVLHGPDDTWDTVLEGLAKQIGDTTFDCDFSTSTAVERLAGRVAMMDAYSPYHGYWMIAVCGIPSITLTGTPDDWREIRRRIDDLPRFGLEHWCRSLVPITDQFVRAAEGNADTDFWKRIYNPFDAYGGERVTGWITRFYPYLGTGSSPNPMLDLPVGEPRDTTEHSIATTSVRATLCRAVINVNTGHDLTAVAVDAGLVGVAQHDDGALEPVAGWAVVSAPPSLEAVLDRIAAEHEWTPPDLTETVAGATYEVEIAVRPDGGGEVVPLYERFGTVSLHGGAWRLRGHRERHTETVGGHYVRVVFDLADGRVVGEIAEYGTGLSHWVVLRPGDRAEDVPVLGTSLAMILESVLDHDEIGHLETIKLSHLVLVDPFRD
ncbi:DUF4419 domain-containing protein [Lentzea sp. NBRC 102530]|uniref:DUF4419 domain-containing protein n=1 Tax=Lentzea sp. NBRC 102530 TaxID=3032201 RepID=UPI0024A50A57|nr:DUF4419 domain-containing protein [Lentzea sp. NBRC 102530]GLY53013.1 hypothetical protein Lesp01_66690 [Lentzea sp. NBRC 102530]